jgi:hypothetical protein
MGCLHQKIEDLGAGCSSSLRPFWVSCKTGVLNFSWWFLPRMRPWVFYLEIRSESEELPISIFTTNLIEVHDSLPSCSECETAYLVYSSPIIYVSSSQASLLSAVADWFKDRAVSLNVQPFPRTKACAMTMWLVISWGGANPEFRSVYCTEWTVKSAFKHWRYQVHINIPILPLGTYSVISMVLDLS